MANKKGTTARVWVNTGLLAIMTIVFGVLTYLGVSILQTSSQNFKKPESSLALCTDNENTLDAYSYICDISVNNGEKVESSTDSALFLYERMMLSSEIRSGDSIILVLIIGTMFTVASLVSTVVYFNHNRS